MSLPVVLVALACLLAGLGVGAALAHARAVADAQRQLRAAAAASSERESQLREQLARATAGTADDEALVAAFRSASRVAVQEQSAELLALAEHRYQSLEHSAELRWQAQGESVVAKLSEYAQHLAHLERQRQRDSAVLSAAVADLRQANDAVQAEARSLASAMKDSRVRGTWGEVQLRRVLEQSGLSAHADFVEQQGTTGADRAGRPDVVVRLPNGRCVVIDAKAPLDRYLEATHCDDVAERERLVAAHGEAVARHVAALSARRYDDLVQGSVDFVVMFLPGDAFLSAAFDARPALFEQAAAQDVILASPGTLLAFLRGVAVGWQERQVAESAAQIAELGKELHERVGVFAEHFAAVGGSLGRAVGSYNQALGSLERRLLVTARRFEDHGAASRRSLSVATPVSEVPGVPTAIELVRTDERPTG